MKTLKTRYWIIELKLSKPNELLEFSTKIPNHLMYLDSILLHTKRDIGDLISIDQIGELSIQINNRSKAILHMMVDHCIRPITKPEYPIGEELLANQMVTGYFKDAGKNIDPQGVFKPYELKIYFKCFTKKQQ